MTAKTLMILGTHSNAGKSILVTALCRIFAQDGYRVAPFKAQNMALNAGVTPEGHEIGRATMAQAEAAGIPAHVDMNPILLKPEGNSRSQVVLNGKPYTHIDAGNWHSLKPYLWEHVTAALDRLRQHYDLVIMEGAGSPAEINLKEGDIVNMRVAQYARSQVLLVGDIDQGGVFAALVGTMVLLEPDERALVKGFVINKFRGDISLLGNGLQMLQERAFNTPTLGVIPYLPNIGVAAEDSVVLDVGRIEGWENGNSGSSSPVDIAVIRLPRISNFDDFDPLAAEPGVQVRFVERLDELGTPNAIILPGSKMTLADLAWLRESDLAEQIVTLAQIQTPIVGICGGYQMLGQTLFDPEGIEAEPGTHAPGLGLLSIETTFAGDKHTVQVQAILQTEVGPLAALRGTPLQGYEIHMGRSQLADSSSALCQVGCLEDGHFDGALSADGQIWGTYLHGLFDNDALRHAWLRSLGWQGAGQAFDREQAYNRLADHVRAHLDMEALRHMIWEA
jgi:adenosylcobyric acid synthase